MEVEIYEIIFTFVVASIGGFASGLMFANRNKSQINSVIITCIHCTEKIIIKPKKHGLLICPLCKWKWIPV